MSVDISGFQRADPIQAVQITLTMLNKADHEFIQGSLAIAKALGIKNEEVKFHLIQSEDISFDGEHFIIADVAAYIQATWRTSRMYVEGLTKGLSIVFVDNKKAFNNLQKRMRWFYDDIKFEKLEV